MNFEDIKLEKEPTIIFMGTPEFSATVLKSLMANYKIRAIVTQPDRKIGRNDKVVFSPVKQIAFENDILCLQPEKIRDILQDINVLEPDLIITCAYGQILPIEMLQLPTLGCINVHASLLPKLRGGAPIHHAIMDGYSKTGITIMYMDKGMDTGDIISQQEITINEDDTAESLHDKLAALGSDLLLKTLPSILSKTNGRVPQDDSQASYGFNITREDEHINFSKTKREIVNKVRGLNSWPGAYCLLDGRILKVWKSREGNSFYDLATDGEITNIYDDGFGVKVSNGEVVFTEIQLEGKRKMAAKDFINGYHEKLVGKILR